MSDKITADSQLDRLMKHLRERHSYLVGIGAKETYEGTAHAVIESQAKRIAELIEDQRVGMHAILDVAELKKRIAAPTDIPRHALWDHLHHEHGLTLMESELDEIIQLAARVLNVRETAPQTASGDAAIRDKRAHEARDEPRPRSADDVAADAAGENRHKPL